VNKETYSADIINVRIHHYFFNVVLNKHFEKSIDIAAPAHNHHYFELHILMEGDCVIVSYNKEYSMEVGNTYLIAPGLYHYLVKKSTYVKKYSIRFGYSKLKKDDFEVSQRQEEFLDNLFPVRGFHILKESFQLNSLVESMHYEIAAKSRGFYVTLQALFIQLIVVLARTVSLNKSDAEKIQIAVGEKLLLKNIDTRKCLMIENFFDDNCHRPDIHPGDLAKLLFVSERHLHRILIETYELSFQQKLIETRIELAKYLFINQNLTVAEVCDRVGYSAVNTFSNLFRKKTGITPAKYKTYSK